MLIKSVMANGFIISETFKSAWELFKKNWIIVYGVQLLPVVVAMIYSMWIEGVSSNSGFRILWSLLYLIIQFILSMGVIKAILNISKKKEVTLETFTSVAPKIINFIVAQVLMGFIVLGGLILFIIPGIYFALKYMYTPYLVIDKGMGPIEALKASGKITHGIKWDLIGFLVASSLLAYSGILFFVVGFIVTMPLATLAQVVYYNRLVKRL